MFTVSNSSFRIAAKQSNIGGEGRAGYAGRKIVVEPGQIYVFMTGVMDQNGLHETYYGGEIIYVSNTADMKARRFVALNERAAELTVVGERDILGITTASDKATITVRITLTVKDPFKLASYYASMTDADIELSSKVEKFVLQYIENSLAMWSQPEHELVNIITTRINTQVETYGLALLHANTLVQRTMPKALAAVQAEARMADMSLLEALEAKENGTPADALHQFDRKWGGTIFTPKRVEEWLAAAHVGGKATHGKAFMQLVVAHLTIATPTKADTDDGEDDSVMVEADTLSSFLLDNFHAVAITKYVQTLRGTPGNQPSQEKIQDSVEIVLNSFV